jgi:elongation factor G
MKAVYWVDDLGLTMEERDIPAEMLDEAKAARETLVERIAETDDDLTHRFLEGEVLPVEELKAALRKATIAGKIVPVLCGSSLKNKGVQPMLDAVIDFLPSPAEVLAVHGTNPDTGETEPRNADDNEPFCALVFKIVADPYVGRLAYFRVYSGVVEVGDIGATLGLKDSFTGDTLCDPDNPIVLEAISFPDPVIEIAIEPKTASDQDKMGEALRRLAEEDPTFRVRSDENTGQTLIAGMGELHLEVLVDRMLREYRVQANVGRPKVAYRETITKAVKIQGRFVRQSGGRGQYGDVWLELEPREKGAGYEFENAIVGGTVPKEYIPAIEKGAREAMEAGVLAGYPMVDVLVRLIDGSYHEVDSNEMAFKIAASMAVNDGALKAKPVLLEPVMKVEVTVPDEYTGDVMGNISARRGQIEGMDPRAGNAQAIRAHVPLANMFGYATDLRSSTQGRGTFTMELEHYAQVPENVAQEILTGSRREPARAR